MLSRIRRKNTLKFTVCSLRPVCILCWPIFVPNPKCPLFIRYYAPYVLLFDWKLVNRYLSSRVFKMVVIKEWYGRKFKYRNNRTDEMTRLIDWGMSFNFAPKFRLVNKFFRSQKKILELFFNLFSFDSTVNYHDANCRKTSSWSGLDLPLNQSPTAMLCFLRCF